VPYFALKFRNGYVPGIVATAKLDRWLSYGVYLARFARGRWYQVPARASAGMRELTVSLKPLRLTRVAVRRSRYGSVRNSEGDAFWASEEEWWAAARKRFRSSACAGS
jgi:hypothetical protein